MKTLFAPVAAVLLVWAVLAPSAAAAADSDTFKFLAGAGLLCGLPVPNPCPDVAQAANGDTVSISGAGMLSIHAKSASGGGTFTHTFSGGQVHGTWVATDLLSFVDYGSGTGAFGPPLHAGNALIRVNLLVGGAVVHTGILEVTCRLPGAGGPSEMAKEEGVRLNVQGGVNFNERVSGLTVFIQTSG